MSLLKQFLRKYITFLEKRLSVTQRKWISITLGIIIPIAIHLYEEYCPVGSPWFKQLFHAIEFVLPSLIICLLWDEVGRLRDDAQTDKLTGLFNRRGANEELLTEVNRIQDALRGTTTPFQYFGVVALDLDKFKLVNDTFGHEAGDKVLVIIADIMKMVFNRRGESRREMSRRNDESRQGESRREMSRRDESGRDIACRIGGDEFVIILSDSTPEVTLERAKILCKAIADDSRLQFENFSVTASVGVASIKVSQMSQEEDVEAALHNAIIEADQFIYSSKRNGRNSVSGEPTRPTSIC